MREIIAIMILLVLAVSPAAAKSKAQVAGHCLSQREAHAAYAESHLRYRVVAGARCWYAPGKVLVNRKAAPKRVRVASLKLQPVALPDQDAVTLRDAVDEKVTPVDLDRVKRALCGGPCPRFDLDDRVYIALCGGPCPDFRERERITVSKPTHDDDEVPSDELFKWAFEAFGDGRR